MSSFPTANLIDKLSFNLQPHFVSLPWLKRSIVRCFSQKADGSGPVRYVPKKLRDVNQTKRSSSRNNAPKDGALSRSISSDGVLGHKTLDGNIRPRGSKTAQEQSNVSFDDGHGVNVDETYNKRAVETKCFKTLQEVVEYMNVPEETVQELQVPTRDSQVQGYNLNQANNSFYGLMEETDCMEALEGDAEETQLYDGVGEGQIEISNSCRSKRGAEKAAIELLAKRAFTGVELRKKLIAKKFSVNVAEAVVGEFQDRGLINDSLYAELFSHSRWKSSSWGPRRIKQALVKKGVSEVDVFKAVNLVFEDSEDCEHRSSTRLSDSSLQKLYVQASKQWQRSQNVTHETRKARIIRWLQYRGFDWAVVGIILKKVGARRSCLVR